MKAAGVEGRYDFSGAAGVGVDGTAGVDGVDGVAGVAGVAVPGVVGVDGVFGVVILRSSLNVRYYQRTRLPQMDRRRRQS